MTTPQSSPADVAPIELEDEDAINDPGNEDPGSIEKDATVPLIKDDDVKTPVLSDQQAIDPAHEFTR